MTPRNFLQHYRSRPQPKSAGGEILAPLSVERGDVVGVVLLYDGGPDDLGDVEPYLYRRFMDPVRESTWWGARVHHHVSRWRARSHAPALRDKYEAIGGSPVNRLVREQARALKTQLNDSVGDDAGVYFRTYRAMRYWHPLSEDVAAEMQDYGVDRIVLAPLYPQFSSLTTGSSVACWKTLRDAGHIPTWPTTLIPAYAANPKYVQAVSERIDEALQRFPRSIRDDVHLLFCGTEDAKHDPSPGRDPYQRQFQTTVDAITRRRSGERPFHTCMHASGIDDDGLTPSMRSALANVVQSGARHVLVVPVSRVTDHLSTHYTLDIEVRDAAESMGIYNYEVASGLNAHPLFIEALSEAIAAQLRLPPHEEASETDVHADEAQGDGVHTPHRGAQVEPADTEPADA